MPIETQTLYTTWIQVTGTKRQSTRRVFPFEELPVRYFKRGRSFGKKMMASFFGMRVANSRFVTAHKGIRPSDGARVTAGAPPRGIANSYGFVSSIYFFKIDTDLAIVVTSPETVSVPGYLVAEKENSNPG
ncbi:hypothetical protein EVAR_50848_1 [Eumeta japonica]|uniref:Uncharacterized protein n=1 Tax=Eumeta variegata TaxID=151549 RepID=A0A4C1XBY9_EUMVA|nr:hypothetical protein EVAR_50848_1 [Eumeta japonica]